MSSVANTIMTQQRWGAMKEGSTLKKLAAGSLTFVKAYSTAYNAVDKLEQELDAEIERESKEPSQSTFARFRQSGRKLIHSKHILLIIVALNIIDCALVLGELILDLHHVKDTLNENEEKALSFLKKLNEKYPERFGYTKLAHIEAVYDQVLHAALSWGANCVYENNSNNHSDESGALWNRTLLNTFAEANITSDPSKVRKKRFVKEETTVHTNSIGEDIAHAFHKASITILGILVVLTLFKILVFGKHFFSKTLEVFDSVVITASFVVDLAFLKGMTMYSLQDFVFILAFMLPWRVIRVVNSLVVAVMDHEHFRLKLLYTQKKKIDNDNKHLKTEKELYSHQLMSLTNLCRNEGLADWKVERTLAREPPKAPRGIMGSLSSLAFSAFGAAHRSSSHPLCSYAPNKLRKGKSEEWNFNTSIEESPKSSIQKMDNSHLWSDISAPNFRKKDDQTRHPKRDTGSDPDIFITAASRTTKRLKYKSRECSANFDTISSDIYFENSHKMWIGSDDEMSSITSAEENGQTEASVLCSENDECDATTCTASVVAKTDIFQPLPTLCKI